MTRRLSGLLCSRLQVHVIKLKLALSQSDRPTSLSSGVVRPLISVSCASAQHTQLWIIQEAPNGLFSDGIKVHRWDPNGSSKLLFVTKQQLPSNYSSTLLLAYDLRLLL